MKHNHHLTAPKPLALGALTRIKWGAFRLFEKFSDWRGNAAASRLDIPLTAASQSSIWIFLSTIGELNAIDPLVKALAERLPHLKLVLITDHDHYLSVYQARYPDAFVCVTHGHSNDARELAEAYTPSLLIVGEIPCWPGDAPCRFSTAFLFEAKRRGAAAFVVNGWLYNYPPPCRMDAIERSLFQDDYLRLFDGLGVQTEATRERLIAAGARPESVVVTGNIKFDAMQSAAWTPAQARSPQMLTSLLASSRPIVVAGCVTDFDEQTMILDAFVELLREHPEALLVLAPRHPEVTDRMRVLGEYLAERQLSARFRSTCEDAPIENGLACLVLDTIGELRDFYAIATLAHVGVDHNVLEPLGFGKLVTVKPGWDKTYPSYPVYRMLMDADTLVEATDAQQLAAGWRSLLDNPAYLKSRLEAVRSSLEAVRGALARNLRMLEPWLDALTRVAPVQGQKR